MFFSGSPYKIKNNIYIYFSNHTTLVLNTIRVAEQVEKAHFLSGLCITPSGFSSDRKQG